MAKSKPQPAAAFAEPRGHEAARNVIRIPKTAEVVAGQIRKAIIRGQVKAGDCLPPEAQLIEHFGASRPTIREAFRILENEQLISVTRGSRSGAKVHAPSVDSVARYAGFALQAQAALLSDIYEARLAIEPFAVRLAAERATPAEIARFRDELDQVFARDLQGAQFRLDLVRLHRPLVEMSGNKVLILIWAMLEGVVEQHMSRYVARSRPTDHETAGRRVRAGLNSFRKVVDLIEAADADAAEAHWREHLRNANATWLQGYDQTTLVDVLD